MNQPMPPYLQGTGYSVPAVFLFTVAPDGATKALAIKCRHLSTPARQRGFPDVAHLLLLYSLNCMYPFPTVNSPLELNAVL